MGAAEDIVEVLEDFPSFCSLVEIKVAADGRKERFEPSRWNAEQRTFQQTRTGRDIALKPRQIGFSTMEMARNLQYAIIHPGANVQVITHDGKLKAQLFETLQIMADGLDRLGLLPKRRYSTKVEIVFADTDSAVRISEAGTTERSAQGKGRSGTIHRLHATEMAFWGAAAETWSAVESSVSPEAEVVIESTANGVGGLFYDFVQKAIASEGQYKFHFFPWLQQLRYRAPVRDGFDPAPRDKWEVKLRKLGANDQQIAWWRAKVLEHGEDKTLREFPVDRDSCFRAAERAYFAQDAIDDIFEHVREPVGRVPLDWKKRSLGAFHMYEPPQTGADYVIGGDVSEGTGDDASSATVMEKRTAKTVATFWSDSLEPGDFGLAMAALGNLYNEAMLAPERNNHGHAAIRAIVHEAEYRLDRIYETEDGKAGWSTDKRTRPVLIDDLGGAIRTGTVTTPDHATATECKTLVRNEKGKVEARNKGSSGGCKDDRWISWCIAFQARNAPVFEYKSVSLGF